MGFKMTIARAVGILPLVSVVAVAGETGGIEPNAEIQDGADVAPGLREACHDMRQPVAGVLALAGAALTDPGLPRVVRERLEQIVQQAERLAELIQGWLRATQPEDSDRAR